MSRGQHGDGIGGSAPVATNGRPRGRRFQRSIRKPSPAGPPAPGAASPAQTAPIPPAVAGSERPRTTAATESAEIAYRRADEDGDAAGAFNLGVLLHQRRDLAGAVAAYERSERRGDPDAAFNLGVLLYEAGELDRAEAAWRRSTRNGHTKSAANLGFLLHRRGELERARLAHLNALRATEAKAARTRPGELESVLGPATAVPRSTEHPETTAAIESAEIAYRRADEDGDAAGAFNLGVLLHQRRDLAGAVAAYERSERRGDPDAAFNLGVLLYEAGELDRAEAAWRRSARNGHTKSAANLGFLLAAVATGKAPG